MNPDGYIAPLLSTELRMDAKDQRGVHYSPGTAARILERIFVEAKRLCETQSSGRVGYSGQRRDVSTRSGPQFYLRR